MKGTDKQVRWAESIKAKFAARVRSCYANCEENKAVIEKALKFIDSKYDDAKYWIDMETKRTFETDLYCEVFCEMTADPEMQALFV